MSPLLLALAVLQAGTPPVLDEGTFLIRRDTAELGRESFRFAAGRLAGGGTGWTLATTARYDRTRPVVVLAPILEVGVDSLPVKLQYDVADPSAPLRILGQLGRGRFTVRLVAQAVERAREFPVRGPTVVLDDSVFALYVFAAWHAASVPQALTALFPRAARREALTVQEHGLEPTTVRGDPVTLRHVTLTGGQHELVHLWLDTAGRLLKVEIPSRALLVERLPAD